MIFDTDILVDYLRRKPEALILLENLKKKDRRISTITHLELLQGCSTKQKVQLIDSFMKQFEILPLDEKISQKAIQIFREHRWQTGMSIPDAYILAIALVNKEILITRNIKDYHNIKGLKVSAPY